MGQGEHGGLYDGFLEGQRRGDHPPEPFELILLTKALDNYVITIGRRFGSLGRAVAREAADLLSIQYYVRDIEEEIAKRMKQPVKEISEVEKDACDLLNRLIFTPSPFSVSNSVYDLLCR